MYLQFARHRSTASVHREGRRAAPPKLPHGVPRRVATLFAATAALWPSLSEALPSFARQMNMACIVCHTGFPELTAFGREFKLSGYTMSSGDTTLPPLAVMLQPSFTRTQAPQAGGAAPGFNDNNNFALTQASLFYAGRLFGPYATTLLGPGLAQYVNRIGVFVQATYDGVGKSWAWDNAEARYASSATFGTHQVGYGVYANNNPTLQDPWNSTPAWSFPFTGSGLAPTPAATALIEGGLAQQVAGVGAYAMFDNLVYVDVAGYHTLGAHLQESLGVDPAGEAQIRGAAPYWRVALQRAIGNGTLEIGTFGLAADTSPGRDRSAGQDRIVDVGFDAQYQFAVAKSDVSATLSWIDERQRWDASQALEATSNGADSLHDFKATLHYLHDKTYGLTAQYFVANGDPDMLLYPDSRTGSPNSDGEVFQLDYLPFSKSGGPAFWPRSNVKLSLQYIAYNSFDGARRNYDGAGRNAHGNNTLYLETWIAF